MSVRWMGCGKEAPHSVPSGDKDKVLSKNPSGVVSFTWLAGNHQEGIFPLEA